MKKIWISGANGQIGRAMNDVINPMEYEIFDTDKEDLDITDIHEVLRFIEISRPDIIVNCSGYTDITDCEENPKEAYRVNALGARNLSIAAKKLEAKMVQISTDDVFDGRSTEPYSEFSETKPVTVYGKSKLAGENYVKEFTYKHFIIRSTWIYGKGENFISRFLRKVETGEPLSIAADQFGSPTSANELAKFILYIANTDEYGTYHATCKNICSRFEFAQEILTLTGKSAELRPVPTRESDFSAVRPANAVLDNFIMSIIDVYDFPDWREALKAYLAKENK